VNPTTEVRKQLAAIIGALGTSVKGSATSVAKYATERAAHLAELIDDPDFEQAYEAERDAVLLKAAIDATRSADATDRAAAQILAASLRIAVMALASG
jgi:hypothetical protein